MRAPSLTAALTVADYIVEISEEGLVQSEAQEAMARLRASGELTTQIKGKTKVFDLNRCVPKDTEVEIRDSKLCVLLRIRTGPEGSLRPEVFVRSALEAAGMNVTSLRTTRTDLLVEDEKGVVRRPV